MKIALGMHRFREDDLKYAKQLGVDHIIATTPRLAGNGYWEFIDLLQLRKRVEAAGLKLAAIENIPWQHYDKILLAAPGRDEQIENVCKTIRNMGVAGIPILGYYFSIVGVWGHWRDYDSGGGRGGAGVKSFDYELVRDAPLTEAGEVSGEEMWSRLTYFLQRVIPVAEEAGVKLAAHPHDPPAPVLRGVARILGSIEGLERLIETVPSECNGLDFCQGTVAEMGVDVVEAIRYFGERGKIFYVHFRNIKGAFPKFDEVFIDEGDVDMLEAMRTYKQVGFDGVMRPDHTPRVAGDTSWGHRGRAFAVGYMKALIQAVNSLP